MSYSMNDVFANKDALMCSEENRLKSFTWWPFEKGPCVKEQMAKAGFYHCNEGNRSDTVRCFCCFKELTNWSSDDQPWVEHITHSKDCLFAVIHKEENNLTMNEMLSIMEAREINKSRKFIDQKMETWSKLEEHVEKSIVSHAKKFSK